MQLQKNSAPEQKTYVKLKTVSEVICTWKALQDNCWCGEEVPIIYQLYTLAHRVVASYMQVTSVANLVQKPSNMCATKGDKRGHCLYLQHQTKAVISKSADDICGKELVINQPLPQCGK